VFSYIFMKIIEYGMRVTAKRTAAELASESMKAMQAASRDAAECIDMADQLEEGQFDERNAYKAEIAELLRQGTIETLKAMQAATNGSSEGQGSLSQANPFFARSRNTTPSFEDALKTEEPRAIEDESAYEFSSEPESQATDSKPRGRGRPPGAKNKPKAGGSSNGQG
jgi:hypothetical protein